MMNTNHPDDELLAAFAGADPDATADPAVFEHLASCDRCTATVAELRSLAIALGELPDLAPHRPLRFLPPAAESRPSFADRVGAAVRGIFAPALTAGAALVLVGAVGTFGPSMAGQSTGGGDAGAALEQAAEDAETPGGAAPGAEVPEESVTASADDGTGRELSGAAGSSEATPTTLEGAAASQADVADEDLGATSGARREESGVPTDRPIWPMVLFSGVTLIVLMVLLRWILGPRAG